MPIGGQTGNLTGLKKAPCFGELLRGDSKHSANIASFREHGPGKHKPLRLQRLFQAVCPLRMVASAVRNSARSGARGENSETKDPLKQAVQDGRT